MKKSIFILVLVWLTMVVPAQTPEKISYQAVIRNSSNTLIVNTNIGMRISVLQGSASGSAVFVERHSPTSNANGLVTLEIGAGTLLSGSFSGINWAAGPYFIKTETDPTGGSSYTITGTSQLLGVPYALYAKNVQNKDDADADPTNEIQLLSISGANLSLSKGGGTVTLPSGGGGDNWGTQVAITDATLSGNGTTSSPLKVAPQSATSGQVLKWNGTTWAPASDETGGGSAGWGLTGNAGTNPASNFIGTTDDKDFIIKRNGVLAGQLSTLNTSYGVGALYANTTGNSNTANGKNALRYNTTGDSNTANGNYTLYSNTTGSSNTANGFEALFYNTTGLNNTANGNGAMYYNTTGYDNTANGLAALFANSTGNFNVAVGKEALYSNTTGNNNTANGFYALHENRTGYSNTANGTSALSSNIKGFDNTATGYFALHSTTENSNTADGAYALTSNTTGDANVAVGKQALVNNTTGYSNTADGTVALYSNTTGFYNTASGRSALYYNTSGNYNTAYGVSALQNLTAGNNNTAVGYDAQVPNATGSNQVRIGNAAVTYASCQVPIISTSDRRLKSNIQKSNLGLDFIKQLNPVFYNRKIVETSNGKTSVSESKVFPKTEYGFIAQELEATLNACGASDNGIINRDDAGIYSVRYNDLIAPMVKAIQEQQVLIEKLTKRIEELEKK